MDHIRNFVIIAHIDHGKSTLADRFLELTGAVPRDKMKPQFLDMMDLEREKGITIKMQPVRMTYKVLNSKSEIQNNLEIRNSRFANAGAQLGIANSEYILNLIDTPGHIDFSYEVSRSLAAVEGAILLVDATKGIQAQTLYNLELARKQGLVIVPAINKIDMPNAQTEKNIKEMADLCGIEEKGVIAISAKRGTNVKQLLEEVIRVVPPPKGDLNGPLRALIFDSKYDPYKGVIAYVRIRDGRIRKDEKIYLMAEKAKGESREVGFFSPALQPIDELKAGDIGYIATGIKEPGKIRTGDTITKLKTQNEKLKIQNEKLKIKEVESLPGYQEAKPMVFVSVYPKNSDDFDLLKEALSKLKLSDAALDFELESKESLGRGFRCGFLGSLHAEIVSERLKREFELDLIVSTPSVVYKIIDNKNEERLVKSTIDWPKDATQIKATLEPWAKLEVMTPINFMGKIIDILEMAGAEYKDRKYFGEEKTLLVYEAPLREIIIGFYDNVLRVTQGYASLAYEVLGFREAKLEKLEIMIAGRKEEAFSRIVPAEKVYQEGSSLAKKLKEALPPQQFSVAIQAVVSGRIIARETIKARGRDVIAPLYGGDYTRKRKLLERQKKGKKELKEKAQLSIPTSVFFEILKK